MKLIMRQHQTIVSQQKHQLCNLLSNTPQPLLFPSKMAEAVLFNLATDILKSLATEMAKRGGSFASQNIQLLCCAKDELQSLEDTVRTIQAVLLDAERQQWHNNELKLWLKRLKDMLCELQDLLDDVATEDLRWKVTSGNKMLKAVRIFFSKSNQLAHHLKVANKIQELRKKLVRLKNDREFNLERHLSEATLSIVRRTTHSFAREEEIIGREEDKKKIIAHLLDSSSRESVSVVSIVGIGGLGKTALAELVYNDDKVNDYFELKMWVCHGDPKIFDVDLIIKDILKSAQDECREDPEMRRDLQDLEKKSKDQLQRLLRKVLDGKKYLLVLDDLWNEDRLRWLELQPLLIGGSWGSKILVTTRSKSVVHAAEAKSVIHVLRGLSEDKSWDLFKKMAFGDGEQSFDPALEKIGRDIVKKCRCVPLAIKTVGSLLYNKKENEWLYLQEHELSKIDKLDHGFMEVLKFSYNHLPSWLKHCFAYCALFPKDFVFDKHTMIQLWMAQGFIESSDANKDLEQIGDSYVSDLLCRSFLEVEQVHPSTGEVTAFMMHDLMHDLALAVAGDECKMFNLNEGGIARGIRHASFVSQSFSLQEMTSLLEESNLRTFLYMNRRTFGELSIQNEYQANLSKFRHCRALGFSDANFCIPPSLGSQLKHLRFLDLSGNRFIESLPDSITDLLHLQTLNLSGCLQLKTLPRDLRKLVNLRHLLIDGCSSLSHMPCGLNHLSLLHTLSQFTLSKMDHKVPGGVGSVDELGELNKLVGSITLQKLEFLQLAPNKGYLREKQHLRTLELEWSTEQQDDKSESDELILWENLRPHPNLADLNISSYMGRSPPNWLSSTKNLVELTLLHCKGWKYLPSVSELPSLRQLALVSLDALEFVQEISDPTQSNTASPFFPSLEKLHLYHCGKLKGWWGRRQLVGADQDYLQYDSQSSFSKLSLMDISDCPLLNSVPLFPWIETLRIDGVSAKLLVQQVMAFQNATSEGAVVSTSIPLSKVNELDFSGGVDLEHSLLESVLRFLGNLEYMSLSSCLKLSCLAGLQYLSSLQQLELLGCKELDLSSHNDEHGTQWRSLVNLRHLILAQLPKLVALPEGIQHVTTLQYLEVDRCKELKSLPKWIGNFSSLHELEIYDCPSLMCLPDGMRRLTSLKKLRITGCPALEERCQTESGADWEKIAHVPCLSFESRDYCPNYIEDDMSS
ncbi:putative disease resistance protein RGA3 [Syzygium oleosum]|uniref:putative disease resistance protein RGA3 n=1 Tax=Syzygium oleosum TaxID=219896 RepID=UPI0024BB73A9|nr:putative disease resistance protein RGA3 [Syzygium oleosum]